MPCSPCREAGVECRTTSIPQKRGPRPRIGPSTSPLEQRLAHLESLLSSIPHDIIAGASGLSDAEKKEIHRTVRAAPSPDDSLMLDSPGAAALNGLGNSAAGATQPTAVAGSWSGLPAGPSNPSQNNSNSPSWSSIQLPASSATPTLPGSVSGHTPASSSFPTLGSEQLASYSIYTDPIFSLPTNPAVPVTNDANNPASVAPPPATSSRRNLIYRDKDDQLKFVGPSSGLPLLGLLQELKGNSSPSSNSPESWELPNSSSTTATAGAVPPPLDPVEAALTAKLWSRVALILPAELMHELVRGYFNVSHLLWPILNLSTFLQTYLNPASARPSFIPLVLSMCCLASRSLESPLLSPAIAPQLFALGRGILREELANKSSLHVISSLFLFAVYAEGTETPSSSLLLLSRAVTNAVDMGLHRRVDDWAGFNQIELEVRKRLFWAIYCQSVKACATFGRPPLIRLVDIDVPEPAAVDDAFITADAVGQQPADKPSVQAGFVAAIRLHMLLERALTVVNYIPPDPLESNFASRVLDLPAAAAPTFPPDYLIDNFASELPGDWTFSPAAINEANTIRFFQRTRAYALQQFIRLLIARHKLLFDVEKATTAGDGGSAGSAGVEEEGSAESLTLQHLTQSALGIVGCYATIKARGRMKFFGVHAIAQLTQAGSSLISVALHSQRSPGQRERQRFIVALEGLSACIVVLRHLGERRPAGTRSADILEEFARASGLSKGSPGSSPSGATPEDGSGSEAVRNVRPLSHRETIRRPTVTAPILPALDASTLDWMLEAAFGTAAAADATAAVPAADNSAYAFRPPPRFEVDEYGGWAPQPLSNRTATLAGVPDLSTLGTTEWTGPPNTGQTPQPTGSTPADFSWVEEGSNWWE
ncbi:hypothetical protein T439DRAFT_326573 [Meredithblackwellia eburnea MCA 4105]